MPDSLIPPPFDADYAAECLTTPPPEALQEDFIRYSADLAFWLAKLADAKRDVSMTDLGVKETLATADYEVRADLQAVGKVTEAAVDARVTRHPAVQAARRALIEAEHAADHVRAVVEGMKAKRDMLVGLGATHRAEVQADPVIR